MEKQQEKIWLICPTCREAGPGWLYDQKHLPFYVTQQELKDAGGFVLCEFCETRCVPYVPTEEPRA